MEEVAYICREKSGIFLCSLQRKRKETHGCLQWIPLIIHSQPRARTGSADMETCDMYAGKIPKSSMMGLAMDTLFSILNHTLYFYHNKNKK